MPKTPQVPSPKDFLPLKPVEFLILMTVAAGERHGYGIMLDIAERTEGAVRLEGDGGTGRGYLELTGYAGRVPF